MARMDTSSAMDGMPKITDILYSVKPHHVTCAFAAQRVLAFLSPRKDRPVTLSIVRSATSLEPRLHAIEFPCLPTRSIRVVLNNACCGHETGLLRRMADLISMRPGGV